LADGGHAGESCEEAGEVLADVVEVVQKNYERQIDRLCLSNC
jgi:hypothetical protein